MNREIMKNSTLKRMENIENRLIKPEPFSIGFYQQGDIEPKGFDFLFCILPPVKRIHTTKAKCNQN